MIKKNIACAIDEHRKEVIVVSERGRISSKELCLIFEDCIPKSCTVVSDSQRSYHKLMKNLDVIWIKIPSKKNRKIWLYTRENKSITFINRIVFA